MLRPSTSVAARMMTPGVRGFHGGLKDQDRIFTNLYNEHDRGLKGAMKRVSFGCVNFEQQREREKKKKKKKNKKKRKKKVQKEVDSAKERS
jgi:hypothetical protein